MEQLFQAKDGLIGPLHAVCRLPVNLHTPLFSPFDDAADDDRVIILVGTLQRERWASCQSIYIPAIRLPQIAPDQSEALHTLIW